MLNCDEGFAESDNKSVEGMDEFAAGSDFDADVVFASYVDIFGLTKNDKIVEDSRDEKQPDLNISLRLDTTDQLRKAKKRMEYCFMDDYSMKMKQFKRVDRPEYEGKYTFIIQVGVDESNTVEIKDTVTMCKLSKVDDEFQKSEEDYKPESDEESASDIDTKRRHLYREALVFDPEKQNTVCNMKPLPTKIPVIEINEKASETCEYHWLAKYESIPSNTPFNRFLNKFKNGSFAPKIAAFQGVRYRFLRVGTSSKLSTVKQYNQFVIGNNFTIFRLGMNGSPNVDIGMNANTREKGFPLL